MMRQALCILSLALVSACGATVNHSAAQLDAASHARAKFYKVDLTKEKDFNTSVNLMDDSIIGEFDGVAIQLPVKKELLKIHVEAGTDSNCPMGPVSNTAAGALIKLYPSVDTDNSDSFCNVIITERSGKKSVINIYSVGT